MSTVSSRPDELHEGTNSLQQERIAVLTDNLGLIIHYGEIAIGFAAVEDGTGIEYSMKRMIAHVRAVTGIFNDLYARGKQDEGQAGP